MCPSFFPEVFTGHDLMFEELESLALIFDAVGVSGWGGYSGSIRTTTERCSFLLFRVSYSATYRLKGFESLALIFDEGRDASVVLLEVCA